MTPSQHATLTAQPEPIVDNRFKFKRWFTPTTIVVFIATTASLLGHVMILGSLNQVYKQVNTLTDFTGSCVMNEYTNKKPTNAPTPADTTPVAPVVVPAQKPAAKPVAAPAKPAAAPGTPPAGQGAVNNKLFNIDDIVNKK